MTGVITEDKEKLTAEQESQIVAITGDENRKLWRVVKTDGDPPRFVVYRRCWLRTGYGTFEEILEKFRKHHAPPP